MTRLHPWLISLTAFFLMQVTAFRSRLLLPIEDYCDMPRKILSRTFALALSSDSD